MTAPHPTENAQEIKTRLLNLTRSWPLAYKDGMEALDYITSLEHQLAEARKDAARLTKIRASFFEYELSLHACHDDEAMIHFAELTDLIKESK